MQLLEFTAQQLLRCADDIAGSMAGCKLGLYKTQLDINQNRVLADFVAAKATFTGYVKTALVFDDPSISDDGFVEAVAGALPFRPTDSLGGNQIMYGCWIEDSTAAILMFAGQFDEPFPPMNGPLDSLQVTVRYRPADKSLVVVVS
jgi:hypothetical protein